MTGHARQVVPRTILALALAASAAFAEVPHLLLAIKEERLEARAADIAGLQRDADGTLHIRLFPSFDPAIAALTTAHQGATAQLAICGRTVMELTINAPLSTATFTIAETDPPRLEQIETDLRTDTCPSHE